MASNPIMENFDPYVFQNLTKLKHLNLRNISCPFFPSMLFDPLSSLEYLDISLNPIEDVPSLPSNIKTLYICDTNIIHISSFIMPQLRLLALDNSPNLTSVLLNNFENLTQLEVLSFKNSPHLSLVRLLPTSTESMLLPKLKWLSLQGCAIETLSVDLLPIIQNTAVLDLQNNPWKCDCRMKWINAMNMTVDLINSFR